MMLDFAECDRARLARDPSYDGRFFTGVRTTGVYCRPVCPVKNLYPATSASSLPLPPPNWPGFGLVFDVGPKPLLSVQLGEAHVRL
jgi:Metal binding domain of Ada